MLQSRIFARRWLTRGRQVLHELSVTLSSPLSAAWLRLGAFIVTLLGPRLASATWEPLIDSTDFDGIRADMLTVAGGIVSVTLIIVGLAYLARSMTR